MKKVKKGFISNPTMLVTLTMFVGLASCLLIGMIVIEFKKIVINPLLTVSVFLLLLFIFFFILLIKKFTYKICFDDKNLFQYKGNKLINKFPLDKINMSFLNPRYGYVNIEGINIDGQTVILSFEYSKTRGEIISKYYTKKIENLPERYK